jgi:hypothetical protein
MSNDRDQALLRSAVSDSGVNLFAFVPALGTREALAFGVGVPLPTRLTFTELPANMLPRSDTFAREVAKTGGEDLNFISSVVERWRGATMKWPNAEEAGREPKQVAAEAAPLQPAPPPAHVPPAVDPSRFSLLKKPIIDRPDPYAALRTAQAAQPQRWPAK